jgi:hypothetical protein
MFSRGIKLWIISQTTPSECQEIDSTLYPIWFHQKLGCNHEDKAVRNKVDDDHFIGLMLTTSKVGVVQSTYEMYCTECRWLTWMKTKFTRSKRFNKFFMCYLLWKTKSDMNNTFIPVETHAMVKCYSNSQKKTTQFSIKMLMCWLMANCSKT